MVDILVTEIPRQSGNPLRLYIRYGLETHPFPVPAVFCSNECHIVVSHKTKGILKPKLQFIAKTKNGVDQTFSLPFTEQEFVSCAPRAADFLVLVGCYAGGPDVSSGVTGMLGLPYAPLDNQIDLWALKDFERERIWRHYLALKEQAYGLSTPIGTIVSVAAPYVWLSDLQHHLKGTPKTKFGGSNVELMRDAHILEQRLRCQYGVPPQFVPGTIPGEGTTLQKAAFGKCEGFFELQGFIGSYKDFMARTPTGCSTIELQQGLALIPLGDRARNANGIPHFPLVGDTLLSVEPADDLPKPLTDFAKPLRGHIGTILAYVEASYHKGIGVQAGALWADGRLIFGPQIGSNVINELLIELGVSRGVARSEIEAIGLDKHCETEEWLDEVDI